MSGILNDVFGGIGDITTDLSTANERAVAHSIRDQIKRGASVDAIARHKTDALKTTLSFFRVSGRSRLTYKEDMAKKLVEVFGGDEDKHGKASRGEEEKVARRQEMDNLLLKNINRENAKIGKGKHPTPPNTKELGYDVIDEDIRAFEEFEDKHMLLGARNSQEEHIDTEKASQTSNKKKWGRGRIK